MKKITIKNRDGIQTHGAELLDPTQWIADCVASNAWGLPERDLPASAAFDEADVIERFEYEAVPAIDAVMNDAGEVVQEAIPAVKIQMVKLRAEYTIEIIDITSQVEQEKINAESLAYLASTDWMVIREMDSGVACPSDIKAARAAARAKIVR